MYEVEEGHPIPKGNYRTKYPWKQMKHGDSFYVDGCDAKRAASVKASGKRFLNNNGVNGSIKAESEGGGYRFWVDLKQTIINPLTVAVD